MCEVSSWKPILMRGEIYGYVYFMYNVPGDFIVLRWIFKKQQNHILVFHHAIDVDFIVTGIAQRLAKVVKFWI